MTSAFIPKTGPPGTQAAPGQSDAQTDMDGDAPGMGGAVSHSDKGFLFVKKGESL